MVYGKWYIKSYINSYKFNTTSKYFKYSKIISYYFILIFYKNYWKIVQYTYLSQKLFYSKSQLNKHIGNYSKHKKLVSVNGVHPAIIEICCMKYGSRTENSTYLGNFCLAEKNKNIFLHEKSNGTEICGNKCYLENLCTLVRLCSFTRNLEWPNIFNQLHYFIIPMTRRSK